MEVDRLGLPPLTVDLARVKFLALLTVPKPWFRAAGLRYAPLVRTSTEEMT